MNKALKVLFLLIFFCRTSHATTWGSTTQVSIEPSITVSGASNEMLGFGWFRNGFLFQDSSATCTFNSVFPVSGTVNINGGSLYLAQDLIFSNVTQLLGMGKIIGAHHLLDLCATVTWISAAQEFSDIHLVLGNDITVASSITIKGHSTIDGRSNSLFLGTDGGLIIDSGSTLELKNMTLRDVAGTNISCADDTAKLILNNVNWIQSDNTTFGNGSITFVNNVDFAGSYTFSYESACVSRIAARSCWTITDSMVLSIGRSGKSKAVTVVTYTEPLYLTDLTSKLKFVDSTWHVRSPGMRVTKGTIEVQCDVTVDITSTSTIDGLTFGDSTADGAICFEMLPGCSVSFPRGHFVYDVVSDDWIISKSITSRLIRGAQSVFYIKQDLTLSNLMICDHDRAPFVVKEGKTIRYNNVVFEQSDGEYQLDVTRYDCFSFLLSGNEYIFLRRGNFVGSIFVSGTGNRIQGNGTIAGPISFVHPGAELINEFNGSIAYDIDFNNGTLVLAQDCELTDGVGLQGNGTVNLALSSMIFGYTDELDLTGDIIWQGLDGSVILNSPLNLEGHWVFSGNCILIGNGNTLDLSNGGEIIVAENSTLFIKDIRLKGISGNNIRCLSDNSSINIDDSVFYLSNDFTFTTGKLIIVDEVEFNGPHTFAYRSSQSSTISSYSSLCISGGNCFEVGLSSMPGSSQPIGFVDNSAKLVLKDSILKIPSTGLHLTKGTVDIEGDVVVDIHSTSTSTGLILGDGTQANDMRVDISAGSSLDIQGGHLTYNVTSHNCIRSKSKFSRLRRSADNQFYLKQNLLLDNITLELETPAHFESDPLKWIRYNNVIFKYNDGVHESEYLADGYAYGPTEILLNGNQSIWLDKRSLPVATYISGTGNRISGDGSILQPVTLLNSNAQVSIGIGGILKGGIVLNGGTMILDAPMQCGMPFGPGTVNLKCYPIDFCPVNINWQKPVCWLGDNAALKFNADVCLSSIWAFNGSFCIYGNGNTLEFAKGGAIYVAKDSQVIFKDITLKHIANGSITAWPGDLALTCSFTCTSTYLSCLSFTGTATTYLNCLSFTCTTSCLSCLSFTCTSTNISACLGDNALVVLDDVIWIQDSDVAFKAGALRFKNDVKMQGAATFSYKTTQTSVISDNCFLKLGRGLIFDYSPANGAKNLLAFVDETSILELSGATLHAAATGIELIKGTLVIKADSYLSSDVAIVDDTIIDEGITFGDGTTENDFECDIHSGIILKLQQGSLKYKNVLPSSFVAPSVNSRLYINDNSNLYLYENLDLGLGIIVFGKDTMLYRMPGKKILSSVSVKGNFNYGPILN